LLDFSQVQSIVGSNIACLLACIDAIGDDSSADAQPHDHRPPVRNRGINRYRPASASHFSGNERIEPHWNLLLVPFNASSMLLKEPPHRQLFGSGQLDQLSIAHKEEASTLSAQFLAEQKALDTENLLGVASCLANML